MIYYTMHKIILIKVWYGTKTHRKTTGKKTTHPPSCHENELGVCPPFSVLKEINVDCNEWCERVLFM